MKLKSKSSIQIKKPQIINPQVKISKQQLQQLYQKQGQLEMLEDRVNRSKPILETIYQKIKRKETRHQQEIKQLYSKMNHNSHALHDYKQLYQEALRIMRRNNVQEKYKGSSQYLPHQQIQKKFDWKTINKENSNPSKNSKIEAIKKHYSRDKNISKQQIYKIYKRKLGQLTQQSQLLEDQKVNNRQRSKEILILIEQDIEKLKDIRKRRCNWDRQQEITKRKYLEIQQQKLKEI